MLTCLPQGICSRDYLVVGPAGFAAELTFNAWSEQGTIEFCGTCYDVVKPSFLQGRWLLQHGGEIVAEGLKPSALFRSFEIRIAGELLTMRAASAFTRAFEVEGAGRRGSISPMHAFTRRATIECAGMPELGQLFAFWLAAMMWHRQKDHGGAAGAAAGT